MRPSWTEIDLDAVRHNIRTFQQIAAPAKVCAVVKADAYGHGDVPVVQAALEAGVDKLAVALVEEAVRLREAGIDEPILLLSEPPIAAIPELLRWGLTPTVYRSEFLDALAAHATGPVRTHVKVDTGMHRVGATADEAVDLAVRIVRDPHLELAGVWTHFAVADEDADFTREQLRRFREVLDRLEQLGIDVPLRHAANTAATLRHPEARFDMVRIGIGLYGIPPASGIEAPTRPAMKIISHVTMTRTYPDGTRPSYGRRRALQGTRTVATVPIGYADGLPRALSDTGEVLIGGRRYPLAGTVTMDQIVVDVGDADVSIGDEVVLLGRQGDEEITAEEWATKIGTIAYEVVCQIGPRLPRRYR